MKAYYAMHTFSIRLCENIKMQQKTTYGGEGLQQEITLVNKGKLTLRYNFTINKGKQLSK